MTETFLVTGGSIEQREATIFALLDESVLYAVILEGIPETSDSNLTPFNSNNVIRIAPGCPCCSGNLTMRVSLNRILRRAPHSLYISLANTAHLNSVRLFLSQAPYNNLLKLMPDISV